MKKSKITGLVGTVVLHVLVLLLLFYITLTMPDKQKEGGVPVMLGDMALAEGNSEKYNLTEVDVLPQPEPEPPMEASQEVSTEDPVITQTDEPTIKVKEETAKKAEQKKPKKQPKEQVKPKEKNVKQPAEKPKEKTEAEKRAEEERRVAMAAASKISNAFGKGSQMKGHGSAQEKGHQGSPTGNATSGANSSEGGYGSFDLSGRSLGPGGLPKPVYNVQEEGRVVVTIIVNPEGRVISTSINKRTNTVNAALRRAAENAARKARFNSVDGLNNQEGTIVYYFKLK